MSKVHIYPNIPEDARIRVREAESVSVLTGAGISAESGVPTFRGADGLWKNYRAQDLATPQAFYRDPQLIWEWYNWRREMIAEKKPNPGHRALVELEEKKPQFTLITQNIDGLHALAGSRNILELHGSIWRLRCTACGRKRNDRTVPVPWPPQCPECQELLRPDVVWFGESLDPEVLSQAFAAASQSDVMLVIGTSAVVHPAASLAWNAKSQGAYVIEINLEETPFSSEADCVLLGPSGKILPDII